MLRAGVSRGRACPRGSSGRRAAVFLRRAAAAASEKPHRDFPARGLEFLL